MKMDFPDHFSGHSSEYSAARPTYPDELFDYLASLVLKRDTAWDCATGSGQAAFAVAKHFKKVIATDASSEQIANPVDIADNVYFHAAPAECSGIETDSVDLITVAQALHWFRFDEFFEEVKRVANDRAILAAWSYTLAKVNPKIDQIILNFYRKIDNYWPPERVHVETQYQNIDIPFERVSTPQFAMNKTWTADQMIAYLRTWSAVKRCEKHINKDPVFMLEKPLRAAWGSDALKVSWPLNLIVSRV